MLLAAACSGPAASGQSGTVVLSGDQEHRITSSGSTVEIQCNNGGEVQVLSADVTLNITGSCRDLDLMRNGAKVTAEAIREIDISGSNNEVTATEVREVSIEGNANTVSVDTVRTIDVDGNDNTVTYGSGTPRTDTEGRNNTISAR